MNVETQKEGIYLIIRDPMIYKFLISPKEAWELSRKLTEALFKWKELTGINPLKDVGALPDGEER